MQKKKTAVPTYLGVAAVWIGSHFGPGFATGAFSVRWYVKYGWVGLVTPLLAMLITGGVMYFVLEYAREHGTPNYRPFARSCYGEKLGGVVAVLYDICFLMTDGHRHDPHFRRPLPLWLQTAGKVLGLYDVRHRRRRPADHGAGPDLR